MGNNDQTFFDSQFHSYISQGENLKIKLLLEKIENPCNLRDNNGRSLLHIASRYGNETMTKYFVDLGVEVDARDKHGCTPIALAVHYWHKKTFAILLEANADIYDPVYSPLKSIHSAYSWTQLERSAGQDIQDMWKMVSDKAIADYSKDKRTVGLKIWNAKCSLHLAVAIFRCSQLTTLYVENGYNVNTPLPISLCTALHVAVKNRDLPNVKLLIENGADVNTLDYFKQTPLYYYNCHTKDSIEEIEILEYLMDHGAKLTSISVSSISVVEYLMTTGNMETVKWVLQHITDLTTRYRYHRTVLHFVASNRFPNVMSALQGKTFDVDARDEDGKTALMVTVIKSKNLSSIEFLLDNGADVNAENNGQTPLGYAVCSAFNKPKRPHDSLEICIFLLQRGAKIQPVLNIYDKKKILIADRTAILDMSSNRTQFLKDLLVAQVVLNNELRKEKITDLIRAKIKCHEEYNEQSSICEDQIEKIKLARINESLTLYELMVESDEDLMMHMIDFEFVSKMEELTTGILKEDHYCVLVIKKRVAEIMKNLNSTKEIKTEAASGQTICCIS